MLSILFELVGGPHDGNVVYGVLGEPSDAERYYLFTNHGSVGQRFKVASEFVVETLAREHLKLDKRHHFQRHYYVVTDRLEVDSEVFVRAVHLPQSVKSSDRVVS